MADNPVASPSTETLHAWGRVDLASRISVRAVAAGATFELAALGLLMALGGGFGLWSLGFLDARAIHDLKPGFYLWSTLALIVSAFFGGLVAAVVSRSSDKREGVIHGLITWATACLTGAVLGCTWFMAALAVKVASPDVVGAMGKGMLGGWFISDALALVAALLGGLFGARSEVKHEKAEPRVGRPSPAMMITHGPEPQHP